MKVGMDIRLDGVRADELVYIIRKHAREFDVKIRSWSYLRDQKVWFGFEGDFNRIIELGDYLSHNGFEVELVSAREG